MSYPCVFEFNNQLYMLPETGQNKTLELYKASDESIYNWRLEKVLYKGKVFADATVYYNGLNYYIVAYIEDKNKWLTKVFKLNMETKTIEEIEEIESSQNIKRPAGKFWTENEKLFRPVQNNTERYGGAIIIEEVQSIQPLLCKKLRVISVEELQLPDSAGKGLGTHTLSLDDEIYVVDALIKGRNLMSPIINIIRKVRNKYYKFIK